MRVDYLGREQPSPPPALVARDVARELTELVRSAPDDDQREIFILPEPGCARVADWCMGTMLRPPASWLSIGKASSFRRRHDLQNSLELRIEGQLREATARTRPSVNWRVGLLDLRPKKGETFSPQEVADYLDISRRFVNTLEAFGDLEVLTLSPRVRRVTRLSLVAFLERATSRARCGTFDRDHPPFCYLSNKRAAQLLGVPSRFVLEQIHSGKLRCISFQDRRRISSTELDAFVRSASRRHGMRSTASEWWQPVRDLLRDPTAFAAGDPHEQAPLGSSTPQQDMTSACGPLQQDACEALVRRYLATGEESDLDSFVWPGQTFAESVQRRRGVLSNALVAEVERRTSEVAVPPVDEGVFSRTIRERIDSFVRGVMTGKEHQTTIDHLVQSVVLVTPSNVGQTLRTAPLSSAWRIANLYLGALGARPLGPVPPGVASDGTIYVSLSYLNSPPRFQDFVIGGCAEELPVLRREAVGLRETYSRRWVLDVPQRNRPLFTRASEVLSSIMTLASSSPERMALIDEFEKDTAIANDNEVDRSDLVRVLRDAAPGRGGWQRLVESCRALTARQAGPDTKEVPEAAKS
jgi:excisionase family DNA binding protein